MLSIVVLDYLFLFTKCMLSIVCVVDDVLLFTKCILSIVVLRIFLFILQLVCLAMFFFVYSIVVFDVLLGPHPSAKEGFDTPACQKFFLNTFLNLRLFLVGSPSLSAEGSTAPG